VIDRHPRTDGRLRQVDRRNVGALQRRQRRRQFGFERVDKLAAGGDGRIRRTGPADQHDAGGEGVGALPKDTVSQLRAHGPGAGDSEAGLDDRFQEGFPAGGGVSGEE
jgi:hypothetical protein